MMPTVSGAVAIASVRAATRRSPYGAPGRSVGVPWRYFVAFQRVRLGRSLAVLGSGQGRWYG